jgi:hypothetical protein
MQSVSITSVTKVVSSNPVHGEVYSIQHYMIKFVSETRRWFSQGTSVSSTNKTDCHYITEILLKVALNTINQSKPTIFKGVETFVFRGSTYLLVVHFKYMCIQIVRSHILDHPWLNNNRAQVFNIHPYLRIYFS